MPNGLPSDDTFRRVLSHIDPDAFEACFRRWTCSVVEQTDGEVIAIDGKTLRGSYDAREEKAALCMVSAWASVNRLILAQEQVSDKSNEITAIPALLSALELSGCIVTLDAMGTQRDVARQIIDQGGDYVLALKSNHPTLHKDVRTFFKEAHATDFQGIAHDFAEQTDAGHGRIEVRRCWAVGDVDWLRHQDRWAGLRSLVAGALGLGCELLGGCESPPEGSRSGEYVAAQALDAELDSPGDDDAVESAAEAQTGRMGQPLSRERATTLGLTQLS